MMKLMMYWRLSLGFVDSVSGEVVDDEIAHSKNYFSMYYNNQMKDSVMFSGE
jgi:hypothetical protein